MAGSASRLILSIHFFPMCNKSLVNMLLQNSVHTKYEASNYAPNDKKACNICIISIEDLFVGGQIGSHNKGLQC